MTRILISKWHSVKDTLPKDSKWKIVRCVDKPEECDFYFMAYYYHEENKWQFFDDEYEDEMIVTHWQKTLPLYSENT